MSAAKSGNERDYDPDFAALIRATAAQSPLRERQFGAGRGKAAV